uniref:Cytochrome c assembly protein domain-containing protein n=1 Tax=Salix viminalis TaxID=40686 RepID=A0A6N2MQP3_SALVM
MAVLLRASSKVFHRRSRTQRMLPVFTPTLVNGTVLLSLRRWNNNSMEDFLKSIEERGSRDRLTATYYPKSFYLKNLQFLMHLRLESIKGQLPHKSPLPTLDPVLGQANKLLSSEISQVRLSPASLERLSCHSILVLSSLLAIESPSNNTISHPVAVRIASHIVLEKSVSASFQPSSAMDNGKNWTVSKMKKILPLCQKLVWMTYSQLFLASNRGEVGHDLALRRIVRHPKMYHLTHCFGEVCSGTCAFRSTQLNDSRCASNVESRSGFTQTSHWNPTFSLRGHVRHVSVGIDGALSGSAAASLEEAIHQVLCSFFEAAYEKKGEFFEQFLADNLDGYIIEKLIDSIVYPILEVGIKKRNFSRSDFDFRNLDNYVAIQRHAYTFDPCSLSSKHRSFSRLLTDLKKEESSVNSQDLSFFGMLLREQGVPRTSGAKTKQWEFFVGGKSFDCTRSYSQILIGSRLFLTAMAIHLSLRVAPLDLQQGGNSRIPYVHVPAARMSILVYIATAINTFFYWRFRETMWGTFWVWDARLTSVFISFFIYLGALRFQKLSVEPASISICAGPIDIPIIKSSVNWWNTSHQPGSISRSGTSIHVPMPIPILSNFANSPLSTRIFFVLETRLPIPSFLESPLTEEIEARESIPKPTMDNRVGSIPAGCTLNVQFNRCSLTYSSPGALHSLNTQIETIVRVGHPSSPSRPRFTFQLRSVGLKPPLDSETKDEITIASACMSRMFSAPGGDGDLLRPSPVHQLEPHSSAVDVTISRALQAICRLSACSADLRGFQSPGAACLFSAAITVSFPSRFLRFKIPLSVQSSHEPESFAEAFNHSCWRNAMQEDAQEKKNKTSVSLPAGKQAIGCKLKKLPPFVAFFLWLQSRSGPYFNLTNAFQQHKEGGFARISFYSASSNYRLLFSGMQAQESDLRYGLRQLKKAPRADEGCLLSEI